MPLWTIRSLAWMAFLAIIVLSVVPGDLRPDVMHDKHLEHFAAYVMTGILFAIGYAQVRLIIFFGILLTICAAMLEIAQLAIIGRTASLSDFVASSLATWIGLAVGYFFRPDNFTRWLRPSRGARTD
jgi:VanZ family protein